MKPLNQNKMTAVEWLQQLLFNKQGKFTKGDIEQAKEMEKEQITEAHTFGYVIGGCKGDLYNPEQY